MERDIDAIPKQKYSAHNLDDFSAYMSQEYRAEMERLITENNNYKNEIMQLRKERDLYAQLLKKTTNIKVQSIPIPQETKNVVEIPTQTESQQYVFVSTQKTLDLHNITQKKSPKVINIDISTQKSEKVIKHAEASTQSTHIFTFSKARMLKEMRIQNIDLFNSLASMIQKATSGDSILKYFVGSTANQINAMSKEIDLLKDEIQRIQSKKRHYYIESLQNITAEKSKEIQRLVNSPYE